MDTDIFSDQEILAKTIFGEARGEPEQGQIAVANVVLNRVKLDGWRGHDIRSVCLKSYQFSCWLTNDPNRQTIIKVTIVNSVYKSCMAIALSAINGTLSDNTNGALSYYAKSMKTPPAWAIDKAPCAEIGNHLFFVV